MFPAVTQICVEHTGGTNLLFDSHGASWESRRHRGSQKAQKPSILRADFPLDEADGSNPSTEGTKQETG